MTKKKTISLAQTALATSLIAILANLSIPIQPVPFSLLTFALGLVASLLPPKQAASAGWLYLLLGACGLPVFANGAAGIHHLISPTGGFLWGIPLYLLTTSLLKPKSARFGQLFLANLVGDSLLFLTGWLGLITFGKLGASTAFMVGILPYIPFDLIKLLLVSHVASKLLKKYTMKKQKN